MATVTLLSSATTDTTGSNNAITGETVVYCRGAFDGATVVVEVADENNASSMVPADVSMAQTTTFRQPKAIRVDGTGTYYMRAVLKNAGANTNVTCVAVN